MTRNACSCCLASMPVAIGPFRQRRGGHLGGQAPLGESHLSHFWLLNTFHACHSADNVDFILDGNAKVRAIRPPARPARASQRALTSPKSRPRRLGLFVRLVSTCRTDAYLR